MFYSLYSANLEQYVHDKDGNIVYIEVDGELTPKKTGTKKAQYDTPIEFHASISSKLNEMHMKSWGVDQSSIYSEIVCKKGYLPLSIGSIIWRESEIEFEDKEKTIPKQTSSDYTVVGLMTEGLHEDYFLLQRNSSDSKKHEGNNS